MDIDRPRLHESVPAPHGVEQLLPAKDTSGGASEDREQLELLGRELDRTALHTYLEPVPIDLELADLDENLLLRRHRLAAARDGADACQELPRRKRLGDVVVGTHLEAEDLVTLLDAPGDHDDGDVPGVGVVLQTPAHFPA